MPERPHVFVISDGTGETGELHIKGPNQQDAEEQNEEGCARNEHFLPEGPVTHGQRNSERV